MSRHYCSCSKQKYSQTLVFLVLKYRFLNHILRDRQCFLLLIIFKFLFSIHCIFSCFFLPQRMYTGLDCYIGFSNKIIFQKPFTATCCAPWYTFPSVFSSFRYSLWLSSLTYATGIQLKKLDSEHGSALVSDLAGMMMSSPSDLFVTFRLLRLAAALLFIVTRLIYAHCRGQNIYSV